MSLEAELKKLGLTKKQTEIVLLVDEGLTNLEIANKLELTEGTIRSHLSSVYIKLFLKERAELLYYCRVLKTTPEQKRRLRDGSAKI